MPCVASIGTGQIGDTLRRIADDAARNRLPIILGTVAEREVA